MFLFSVRGCWDHNIRIYDFHLIFLCPAIDSITAVAFRPTVCQMIGSVKPIPGLRVLTQITSSSFFFPSSTASSCQVDLESLDFRLQIFNLYLFKRLCPIETVYDRLEVIKGLANGFFLCVIRED